MCRVSIKVVTLSKSKHIPPPPPPPPLPNTGFDGLPGVVLDIFQVFSPSDEAPPIMEVQLAVPNVAVFSIENLGDLTFDLLFAGSKLASLQVANLAFGEGINRFTM